MFENVQNKNSSISLVTRSYETEFLEMGRFFDIVKIALNYREIEGKNNLSSGQHLTCREQRYLRVIKCSSYDKLEFIRSLILNNLHGIDNSEKILILSTEKLFLIHAMSIIVEKFEEWETACCPSTVKKNKEIITLQCKKISSILRENPSASSAPIFLEEFEFSKIEIFNKFYSIIKETSRFSSTSKQKFFDSLITKDGGFEKKTLIKILAYAKQSPSLISAMKNIVEIHNKWDQIKDNSLELEQLKEGLTIQFKNFYRVGEDAIYFNLNPVSVLNLRSLEEFAFKKDLKYLKMEKSSKEGVDPCPSRMDHDLCNYEEDSFESKRRKREEFEDQLLSKLVHFHSFHYNKEERISKKMLNKGSNAEQTKIEEALIKENDEEFLEEIFISGKPSCLIL